MLLKQEQKRVFTLISGVFFLGSMAAGMIPVFTSAIAPQPTQEQTVSQADQLKQEAQGYELVLKREPNNQVALEGLAKARMEMGDGEGAIAPLETLVKLYPDRVDYQSLLEETKSKKTKK